MINLCFKQLALLLAVSSCMGAISTAQADPLALPAPQGQLFMNSENNSILSNTTAPVNNFNSDLFGGQKRISELQQRYNDRNRDYDMRSQYGLNSVDEQQNHISSQTGFGNDTYKDVFRTARQTQSSIIAHDFKDGANRGDVAQPIIVGGAVSSVAFGNAIDFHLSDVTKLSTRTDLIHGNGEINFTSPAMNCKVSLDARATSDPVLAAQTNSERYRVEASKPLQIFDLSSSVSYGGTSNLVHASLSRPLAKNLSASVGSTKGSDAAGIPSEQTVSLGYGMAF